MSVVDTNELVYDTFKTLSSPNDDQSNDYFSSDNDDDEFYAPDSFSKFFGDFIPDKEIEEAVKRLREERAAVESDESDESIGSDESEAEQKVNKNTRQNTDGEGLLTRLLKKFVRFS